MKYPTEIYYLLPCSCGRKIPVQSRQSGEILICPCGTSLEVPTLSGIKSLEKTEVRNEPKTLNTTWNTGHRLIFLGSVVILISIFIGGWLFWRRPTDPMANFTPEQIKQAVEKLPPVQSWKLWKYWETSGLQRRKRGVEIVFEGQQTQQHIYWVLLAIVAGAGMALTAGGIVTVVLNKKKHYP